jgi:hypothetical protein
MGRCLAGTWLDLSGFVNNGDDVGGNTDGKA